MPPLLDDTVVLPEPNERYRELLSALVNAYRFAEAEEGGFGSQSSRASSLTNDSDIEGDVVQFERRSVDGSDSGASVRVWLDDSSTQEGSSVTDESYASSSQSSSDEDDEGPTDARAELRLAIRRPNGNFVPVGYGRRAQRAGTGRSSRRSTSQQPDGGHEADQEDDSGTEANDLDDDEEMDEEDELEEDVLFDEAELAELAQGVTEDDVGMEELAEDVIDDDEELDELVQDVIDDDEELDQLLDELKDDGQEDDDVVAEPEEVDVAGGIAMKHRTEIRDDNLEEEVDQLEEDDRSEGLKEVERVGHQDTVVLDWLDEVGRVGGHHGIRGRDSVLNRQGDGSPVAQGSWAWLSFQDEQAPIAIREQRATATSGEATSATIPGERPAVLNPLGGSAVVRGSWKWLSFEDEDEIEAEGAGVASEDVGIGAQSSVQGNHRDGGVEDAVGHEPASASGVATDPSAPTSSPGFEIAAVISGEEVEAQSGDGGEIRGETAETEVTIEEADEEVVAPPSSPGYTMLPDPIRREWTHHGLKMRIYVSGLVEGYHPLQRRWLRPPVFQVPDGCLLALGDDGLSPVSLT
ncbi:hypothetical protein OC842_006269 [Tilletia horrida]|uniref:Uncharacterized protein n=1 Tax=Tilletia horrida TaxID=155126 RepID=A0AAN6G8U6_9BASI|nr:hypothetical protein OC842_006269 [Tilletia horrida]